MILLEFRFSGTYLTTIRGNINPRVAPIMVSPQRPVAAAGGALAIASLKNWHLLWTDLRNDGRYIVG